MAVVSSTPGRKDVPTFRDQLTTALDNFGNPQWLGEHSSLAAPYFLGQRLLAKRGTNGSDAMGRGQVLQELIREAARTLQTQGEEGQESYRLLELSFFKKVSSLTLVINDLNLSRATYYRLRTRAIEQLEEALIRLLKPALRLETAGPVTTPVGRVNSVDTCLDALRRGQTVGIAGPGGIGKTTLGALLARELRDRPVFWLTLRPGLNDDLSAVLFSLAYFLHVSGVSALWLQLVADKGKADLSVISPLLRHDFAGLQSSGKALLVCFDEVEVLRPAELQSHAQLVALIEELRGQTPLLVMGQVLPVKTDHVEDLAGLPEAAVDEVLRQAGITLSDSHLARVQAYTSGNPQLVQFFGLLYRSGESLDELLRLLSGAPSVELLLGRVWQRLDDDERATMMVLAVFRRSAPGDAWTAQLASVERLAARRLVWRDAAGGLGLAPVFRVLICRLLSPEDAETCHLVAARIRAARGEMTEAAYHYVAAGQPRTAVQVWHAYRDVEIDQGQGSAALAIFSQVSSNQLESPERELLVLNRSHLRVLVGDYAEAERDLRSATWRPGTVFKAQALRLQGDIADQQGDLASAMIRYQQGLEVVESLLEREQALFHKNLSWIYRRQKALDQAWHEACLARYEAVNLQGALQVQMGDFSAAWAHYQDALALAEKIDYAEGIAKTHYNLASMLALQGELAPARQHSEIACQYYERIGRLTRVAGIKVNLALAHNQAGQPEAAVALALAALDTFERLGVPFGIATAAQALAESHLALGNLEAAEQFAMQVVRQEETGTLPDALRTLGEVRLAQGRLTDAERLCRQAIEIADQNQDRFLAAYAWRVLGRVLLAQGHQSDAHAALDQAIESFVALDLVQEVEKTRAMVGYLS